MFGLFGRHGNGGARTQKKLGKLGKPSDGNGPFRSDGSSRVRFLLRDVFFLRFEKEKKKEEESQFLFISFMPRGIFFDGDPLFSPVVLVRRPRFLGIRILFALKKLLGKTR